LKFEEKTHGLEARATLCGGCVYRNDALLGVAFTVGGFYRHDLTILGDGAFDADAAVVAEAKGAGAAGDKKQADQKSQCAFHGGPFLAIVHGRADYRHLRSDRCKNC